jgi:cold-inducible RNA-binding protein
MSKKLYVGNLNYEMNSSELEQLFAPFGVVMSAQIIDDRDTGRSKGFGFVEMESDVEAEAASAALNGKEHGGRKLTVAEAKSRENRALAFGDGRSGKGAASGGGRSRH